MVQTEASAASSDRGESDGLLFGTRCEVVDLLRSPAAWAYGHIATPVITLLVLVALFFGKRPWEYLLGQDSAPKSRSHLVSDYISIETCISCLLTICMAGAMLVVVFAYRSSARAVPEEDSCKHDREHHEHSILLDNARVFGQLLVIYSSFLSDNLSSETADSRSWLKGAGPVIEPLNEFLCCLALPIICFISGVCSQGKVTSHRLQRNFVNLVMPTLLWVFFVKPVIFDSLMNPRSASEHFQSMFQSFHGEWYLQALVLWRGSVFLLWSHMHPTVAFIAMIVGSCMCGYYDLETLGPFYLNEIFGYLPFFALGYVVPLRWLCVRLSRPRLSMSCCVVALIVYWCTVVVKVAFPEPLPPSGGWYGSNHEFPAALYWDHKLYWTRRVADTSAKALLVMAIVLFVVPRNKTPLTWVGQYTILPFLLHPLAHIWKSRFVAAFGIPEMSSTIAHVLVLLAHVAYALALLPLFSCQPVRWINGWWYKPSWLSNIVDELPYAATKRTAFGSNFDFRYALTSMNHHSRNVSLADDKSSTGAQSTASISNFISTMTSARATKMGSWNGKLPTWVRNGRFPWMKDAREYYWLLLPITICHTLVAIVTPTVFLYIFGSKLLIAVTWIPHWMLYSAFLMSFTSAPMLYGYHCLRFRGFFNRSGSPGATIANQLIHVVVIVAYREPVDVLLRTVATIANQKGLERPPIVVLAAEARDDTRHESFVAISKLCQGKVDRVIMTEHQIEEDETRGKSSNENWAVREIYRILINEEGIDPFEVMVTIVDADSLLSKTYCAECELSFFRQPDGRRLLYSGPLNVYRNLKDADLLVQSFDIMRCHNDVFHVPMKQMYPQSNYSLTLGFCSELDYWTPDNMPEDIHTAAKASLLNYCALTTVTLDSFIVNDVVTGTGDRYIQAKRHQWGITEFAWQFAILKTMPMPLQSWLQHFFNESKREGSFMFSLAICQQPVFKLCINVLVVTFWHLFPFELRLMIYFSLVNAVWSWLWFWIAEATLWNTMLREFDIVSPGPFRWFLLVVLHPILTTLADIYFFILPTLSCIHHATFIGELAYVCAPKGDAVAPETAEPPLTASTNDIPNCAVAG